MKISKPKFSISKLIMWYLGLWIPIAILSIFIGGEFLGHVAEAYFAIGGIGALMGTAKMLMDITDCD